MNPINDSIATLSGLLYALIGNVKQLYNVSIGYGHVVEQKNNYFTN
jgi:hypothetical protein